MKRKRWMISWGVVVGDLYKYGALEVKVEWTTLTQEHANPNPNPNPNSFFYVFVLTQTQGSGPPNSSAWPLSPFLYLSLCPTNCFSRRHLFLPSFSVHHASSFTVLICTLLCFLFCALFCLLFCSVLCSVFCSVFCWVRFQPHHPLPHNPFGPHS